MDVAETVIAFFDARGGLPGATREDKLHCAYLDEKILDSMGIIDMVSQFEEAFDIRFETDHLQSLEFQTVGGVIGIIEQLRAAR